MLTRNYQILLVELSSHVVVDFISFDFYAVGSSVK